MSGRLLARLRRLEKRAARVERVKATEVYRRLAAVSTDEELSRLENGEPLERVYAADIESMAEKRRDTCR